jgi:hypothetical protein
VARRSKWDVPDYYNETEDVKPARADSVTASRGRTRAMPNTQPRRRTRAQMHIEPSKADPKGKRPDRGGLPEWDMERAHDNGGTVLTAKDAALGRWVMDRRPVDKAALLASWPALGAGRIALLTRLAEAAQDDDDAPDTEFELPTVDEADSDDDDGDSDDGDSDSSSSDSSSAASSSDDDSSVATALLDAVSEVVSELTEDEDVAEDIMAEVAESPTLQSFVDNLCMVLDADRCDEERAADEAGDDAAFADAGAGAGMELMVLPSLEHFASAVRRVRRARRARRG